MKPAGLLQGRTRYYIYEWPPESEAWLNRKTLQLTCPLLGQLSIAEPFRRESPKFPTVPLYVRAMHILPVNIRC